MKIDFDHHQGAMIADTAIQNLHEEAHLTIIEKLKPVLGKDGNQWIYLLGEMPINYLAGWGDTPAKAMEDFVKNFYTEKISSGKEDAR